MAHARLCKQLERSHSLNVQWACATDNLLCPLAPLTKRGILDVVRKMLKMFILVLCMESLCTNVSGVCPSASPLDEDLQHLSHLSLAPLQAPAAACLQHGLTPQEHR